jgi:peroxiredoxin
MHESDNSEKCEMSEKGPARHIDRSRESRPSRVAVVLAGVTMLMVVFGIVWIQSAKYELLAVENTQPDILPVVERNVVKLGEPAPNFQLRDLNGRLVTLSDLRGKVVLLNFWATWCGPCRVEMPAMEQLYRTFSRKDFEILAVSTDAQGVAITRPFQQENHLTFPILHDADYRVGLTYGARSLPMTFMVDRQGVVRHQIFGARDWGASEAHQLVQMLMKS